MRWPCPAMPRRLAIAPIAALAVACAPPPPVSIPPVPATADTVWYVSARERIDGRDSRQLADSLEYGFAVYARRRADPWITGRVELALADSARLSREEFVAALRARTMRVEAPEDFAVLFVHGYGTSLREAWSHVVSSRLRARSRAPWVVFCWPSNGAGVDWPRPGELFSRAYRDDSAAATASRPAFAQATRATLAAVGGGRLVLAAHSLGAQLVGEALAEDLPLRITLGADPLRAVAFIAPDVESRRFGDYVVPAVSPLARRVVLYTSSRDRLLTFSRQIHKSDRAGLARPRALVRPGLETVDVTDGVAAEGRWQRVFGTHHAIRRAASTMYDLAHVVGAGLAADCRAVLLSATLAADGSWRLTDLHPARADSAPARCSHP